MTKFFKRFLRTEDGAVTVEWVVLTAAIVGLAVTAYAGMNNASTSLASNTDTSLSSMAVGDPQIGE